MMSSVARGRAATENLTCRQMGTSKSHESQDFRRLVLHGSRLPVVGVPTKGTQRVVSPKQFLLARSVGQFLRSGQRWRATAEIAIGKVPSRVGHELLDEALGG